MLCWVNKNKMFCHTLCMCVMLAPFLALGGCAVIVKKAGNTFSNSLTEVILNHDDLDTVKEALPSYMLLMDSLIHRHPDSAETYASAASLYSAYAGLVFQDDKSRIERLSNQALEYALRALCLEESTLCAVKNMPFNEFEKNLENVTLESHLLFTTSSTWVGWIQAHKHDWNAIAQLPKAKVLMEKLLEQEEGYNQGQGHMYMGALEALVPPSAGGDLEKAKRHFESAITLSDSKNLMAKVLYAKNYARMIFDKELHDQLVNEVLAADPVADRLTLMNMAARKSAQELADSSENYFE